MSGSFGTVETGFHWNFYNRLEEGQMTNNPSEGGNNRLASRMGAPHPGFYHFCNVLTKELKTPKVNLKYLKVETMLNQQEKHFTRTD